MSGEASFEAIARALRLTVSTLRDAHVPFALGGSFAAWARGGPRPYNDLDLIVKSGDAERALRELAAAGMETERPPEEWLVKAWHEGVLIDLIFAPAGLEITDEVLARAETLAVFAVATPVMALEDMLQTKLMALDEHSLDYSALLRITRSVREQIDWRELEARTAGSVYAEAFFTLARGLGIALRDGGSERDQSSRVRVMPSR